MQRINPSTRKNLILLEAKKNPHLGVRSLSRILKEKHQLDISKSAISAFLRARSMAQPAGRKKHLLLYQSKFIQDCGLFLLRAIDSQIGLCDFLKEELRAYFPRLNLNLIKKLILMFSFSAYLGVNMEKNVQRPGFLRLCECFFYPARNARYFLARTLNYKPAVSLVKIKEGLRLVSTVKFYFANNTIGFSDAKLTTLWDRPCHICDFFMPAHYVRDLVLPLLKDKTIIISYTKSFNYLSPLTLDFIDGITCGISRIELLDEAGKAIEQIKCDLTAPGFIIGYYPRILSKGTAYLEKVKRFKKFPFVRGSIFYVPVVARFSQPAAAAKPGRALILNNILLKNKEKMLPNWAILTNKKTGAGTAQPPAPALLKKYLWLFPYMEEAFLKDMKKIEDFFLKKENKKSWLKYLPEVLTFEKEADFKQIAEILAGIFTEQFNPGTGLKPAPVFINRRGRYIPGKDFCKITMKSLSPEIKREINNSCFYINGKRVFVL